MTLAAGLYHSQDQQEDDLTNGPGWTIDDQKPGMFDNLAKALPRGVGQGVAAGISVLAKGLQFPETHSDMDAVMSGPAAAARATQGKTALEPWQEGYNAHLVDASDTARSFAKTLIPDPRITGSAANLVQGFGKAATEFTVGSLVGGPLAGATLLGASEGYGHYQDLLDSGVDDETATKSGLLTAMTSGGSALLPMSMPAKWLAGLSTAGALAAQAGAGVAINTSFGAASRYASAKILTDAGYHEQAEQEQPWDATNLLTDAITGAFFGAHAGWHGLKNVDAAHVDPAIRDAAKVVQDRQEVMERAPGVPVDMPSAAVHRQALETALGDLMTDKPVDLSDINTAGAAFARPEIDESAATQIIRDAFVKSGVLDDAAQFDRWLAGDFEIEPPVKPEKAAPVEAKAVAPEPKPGEEPQEPTQVSPGALADRPDLQIVNEHGEALHAGDEQQRALDEEAQANKEAEPMHQAAVECESRFG